ncbi:MAG TPA: ankyrin repeat domain-containing protein [Pyrinomonadaceae bacterium]|nr:ankyrin repeat domain-containing protein [Pyrinomonadaceae bacterium]
MNKPGWILGLAFSVSLISPSCYGPRTLAQQNRVAPDSEQEFFDAIKQGDANRVGELLKQKPELIKARTKKGTTPVMLAMFSRHKELAESLASGIEINIFEASALGRVERVRELVKKDPTLVKAFSPEGFTALHGNLNHTDVVELLIDYGADINAVSKNNFMATPLQSALAMGWTDAAKLLIARNANVNCCGAEGGSPLHEAAGNGQLELAKLLLDHGANVNAKDDHGKTPLSIALEYKQTEMAKFLRDHKGTQ